MIFYQKRLGNWGEEKAVDYLRSQGYEILERNFRCRLGEIDIIAKDGESLVFVEVKTKSKFFLGAPEEMVVKRKKQKIIKIAEYYLIENEIIESPWRIDVVSLIKKPNGNVELKLIKNAIEANIDF